MQDELIKVSDRIAEISQEHWRKLTKEQKDYFDKIICYIWDIIEAEDEKGAD